ncbi:glutamate 5-kinase [Nitrogeniibacter mangrovi]|uniref:Glutamate 5-kinase n=1 Tax=Nitrogeniibacter mangrovi TaxID=2016596 RepID=A0A6C1B4T7_9RHOO|nr:glutamate 5-kinase [Nitrogeniibacter mangrovi]QID18726.1 glutamate 5-kinase [Nitrogeniibacter mangrovi]
MRDKIRNATRLVVKVGSALVTNNGAGLDHGALADWARQIAQLQQQGRQIALVSSGAIAAGMQRLGWRTRPHEMHKLQAAAAVGQMGLAQAYEDAFSRHGLHTAQILLTHDDLADRKRYLNARSTITTLLKYGVVPIINENDTVVTDEIKFGDNDTLGALVANLIEAEALIILTDQDGLFTADPRKDPDATLISEGQAEDPVYRSMAGGAGSGISKGGMLTKILAAQRAARSGAHTMIVGGRHADALARAAGGEPIGTLLHASSTPLQARKQWLADHLKVAGTFVIDAGAAKALRAGKSLLPVGIVEVEGDFERGAAVACRDDETGVILARGLSSYSSAEARRLKRKPSREVEATLGYVAETEAIHRDNLILL